MYLSKLQYQIAQGRESDVEATFKHSISHTRNKLQRSWASVRRSADCTGHRGQSQGKLCVPFLPLSLTALPALGMPFNFTWLHLLHPSNTHIIFILDVTEMLGEGGFLTCIKWMMPPWARNRQPRWSGPPPAWLALCRQYRTLWAYTGEVEGGWQCLNILRRACNALG